MAEPHWIQKAINPKHKGALRRTTRRRFGKKGFTTDGDIKVGVLKQLAKERGKTGRRARLALTLDRLSGHSK